MVEAIILVIGVVLINFKCRQLGRDQLTWAVIAAAGFVVPMLFFGKWVFPMVNDIDPYVNVVPLSLDMIGIGFGIIGVWLVFMRLMFLGPAPGLRNS